MPQEDQGAPWAAVEKDPTPVVMAGNQGHPGHAGAALRALGSIWLVTLMFLAFALAAFSIGSYFVANSQLSVDSDGAKLDSTRNDQLGRVKELIAYKAGLDETQRILKSENTVALKPLPEPPSLWLEIAARQADNQWQRDRIKAAKEAVAKANKPKSSPGCLDPKNPLCR